ncbi:hypothetical protein LCGC14_2530050 [marine sediment metagenome]|uniref:Uncharacterized protein n=1 Tax=marine sediment metagenome TaxID=412755 RepID=A0A0F9BGN9_9ZZZZ
MGELGIVLAIVLCAWVYATLHEYNKDGRGKVGPCIVTNALLFGAIAAGIASAFGL